MTAHQRSRELLEALDAGAPVPRPQARGAVAGDVGEPLAVLDRGTERLVVQCRELHGRAFVGLRIEQRNDRGTWVPMKAVSVRKGELREVAAALLEAVNA